METALKFIWDHQDDNWLWLAVIFVACTIVMLAFPIMGVPEGYDITQHLRFAASYHDAILDGSFLPVWSSIENFGFGSVGIRVYPPFADYLLGITQIFTNDWYNTLSLNSVIWMFPGCIGVYLWVKEIRSSMVAAFAAILYAIFPYHLLQVYLFQLYAEFVASAILPFCFLFVTRLIRRGKPADTIGLAVSCSLLILTHIPSSMIGFASLGIYASCLIDWKEFQNALKKIAAASFIALCGTAFYLVPLCVEMEWVKHDTDQFSTGFYDHGRHLFPLIYNFGDLYWQRLLWILDLTIIFTFVALIPLLFCNVRLTKFDFRGKRERKMLFGITVTGLFSFFMLSMVSGFVWNTITFLQKTQFPWRFLSVGSLMAVVALAVAVPTVVERYKGFSRVIVYPVVLLIFSISVFDFTQIILMAGQLPRAEFYELTVNKMGDQACSCWWPVWAEGKAFENKERLTAGNRNVSISWWKTATREFSVTQGEPVDVRVATFYYPYWKATVNDLPIEIGMDENGVITVPVPSAASSVRLYFEEPFIYRIAGWLSFFTWATLLLVLGNYLRKNISPT